VPSSSGPVESFGDSLVLAASFEDIVLIDLATKIAPEVEVVFLDTEAHFPETLAFVDDMPGTLWTQPHRHEAGASRLVPLRLRPVLPVPQGGTVASCPRWEASVVDLAQAVRRPHPRRCADRELGCRVRAHKRSIRWRRGRKTTFRRTSLTTASPFTRSFLVATAPSGVHRPRVPWPKGKTSAPVAWAGADKSECGLHV